MVQMLQLIGLDAGINAVGAGIDFAGVEIYGAVSKINDEDATINGVCAGTFWVGAWIYGADTGIYGLGVKINGADAGINGADAGINGAEAGINCEDARIIVISAHALHHLFIDSSICTIDSSILTNH